MKLRNEETGDPYALSDLMDSNQLQATKSSSLGSDATILTASIDNRVITLGKIPFDEIVCELWPRRRESKMNAVEMFHTFMKYYEHICGGFAREQELELEKKGTQMYAPGPDQITATIHGSTSSRSAPREKGFLTRLTHRHLTDALLEAYRRASETKLSVISTLEKKPLFAQLKPKAGDVCKVLEAAVSVGIMVEIHTLEGSQTYELPWKFDQSLDAFIKSAFPKSTESPRLVADKSLSDLHWKNLSQYAKVAVTQTKNVSEHLTLKHAESGSSAPYTSLLVFNLNDCLHELRKYDYADTEETKGISRRYASGASILSSNPGLWPVVIPPTLPLKSLPTSLFTLFSSP